MKGLKKVEPEIPRGEFFEFITTVTRRFVFGPARQRKVRSPLIEHHAVMKNDGRNIDSCFGISRRFFECARNRSTANTYCVSQVSVAGSAIDR
jgi:hypothetical protein